MRKRDLRKTQWLYIFYNIFYMMIFLTMFVLVRQPMNYRENFCFYRKIRTKRTWAICLTISMTKKDQ